VSKSDRDTYDLTETVERRLVLKMVLDKEVHTWAGDAISNATNKPLEPQLQQAFHDLTRAGLVIGEIFTGAGYAAAVDWGLRQAAKGR
jgi:hypothetical protein